MQTASYVTVETSKSVESAMAAVDAALKSRQFGVLWHLDMNEKLVEKGLEAGPAFHVLEVCSAPRAKQALTTNQQVGMLLPCKVVVYEDQATKGTQIGYLRPDIMMELLHDEALRPLATEVERILDEAVREAAAS
ncbi:MAG: DUF302 domain-containing protein [Thermaerobacter sp.]|nr:DUF302 domain-containing protein [Thermaerobacter sp.]